VNLLLKLMYCVGIKDTEGDGMRVRELLVSKKTVEEGDRSHDMVKLMFCSSCVVRGWVAFTYINSKIRQNAHK
jgi:hypothetical protein